MAKVNNGIFPSDKYKMSAIKRLSFFIISFLILVCYIIILFPSCQEYKRNKSHADILVSSIEKGKVLAAQYCQSCHLLPDPSLLDSKSWEKGVLPQMGPRLGIFNFNFTGYPSQKYDYNLDRNFYPSQPVLRYDEWQNIIDYYTAVSPDTIIIGKDQDQPIKDSLPLFSAIVPSFTYSTPATSFVKIDESVPDHRLIINDVVKQTTYILNKNLKKHDSIHTKGPVVDIEVHKNEWIECNIGILNPHNGKYGKAQKIQVKKDGKLKEDTAALFDKLARPVQVMSVDINKDGREDYVVCEFGYLQGSLSWMENAGNKKFNRHILRPLPGAIKVYVQDYNKDGLPDIWALFSQGEEGVFLFTNKGNGQFDQKQVLRFPSVYGSSYFEFADFNKDGFPDIVYTCGDNADFSPILKPYHGVYIFINDGKYNFKQQYFFHINGCYKAIARDYDNDGDIDIAAISYFADYKRRPEEGFVYLENKGDLKFSANSLPQTQSGRWLTMDAGDLDGDGKIDLVLGNFIIAPTMMKSKADWKKGPPFLILKNRGKQFKL